MRNLFGKKLEKQQLKLSYVQLSLFCGILILLSGCISLKDAEKKQLALEERSRREEVAKSPVHAAQRALNDCLAPNAEKKWVLKFVDSEALVWQDSASKRVGLYKVLCFDSSAFKDHALAVSGHHVGGGSGNAFFAVPKVSLFNDKLKALPAELAYLRQNKWSGHLDGVIFLPPGELGKIIVVAEIDNRSARVQIGSYKQYGSAGLVPIVMDIDMWSYPVGTLTLQLKPASQFR